LGREPAAAHQHARDLFSALNGLQPDIGQLLQLAVEREPCDPLTLPREGGRAPWREGGRAPRTRLPPGRG
jgi:hypothetical protein